MRVWKGMLVSLNEGIGREAKELLLFLALEQRPEWFSSDGVLRFAPLIVAGLVRVTPGPIGQAQLQQRLIIAYLVGLTSGLPSFLYCTERLSEDGLLYQHFGEPLDEGA